MIPTQNTGLIENIGIQLETQDGLISIFACYFPGGAAGRDDLKKKQFAADISKLTYWDNYILGGDFISRHHSWGCLRANCSGNTLLEKDELIKLHVMLHTCLQLFHNVRLL